MDILESQDLEETTKLISLIPDVVGTYKVVFADGSMADTITINSALYIGMPETGLTCGTCHANEQAKWEGTGHANTVQPYVDDPTGHFANYCMPCHSTGYDVNAANDGFDDFPFHFP